MEKPAVDVSIDGIRERFGIGEPRGHLDTDLETFVRLTGGRRADAARYALTGVDPADLVLFA